MTNIKISKKGPFAIIHLTDFHFKINDENSDDEKKSIKSYYDSLFNTISNYIDVNKDYNLFIFLLTGDFYDKNTKPKNASLDYLEIFTKKLKKLKKTIIYSCAGNHDIRSEGKNHCIGKSLNCTDVTCNCDRRNLEIIKFRKFIEEELFQILLIYSSNPKSKDVKLKSTLLGVYDSLFRRKPNHEIAFKKYFKSFLGKEKEVNYEVITNFLIFVTNKLENNTKIQKRLITIVNKYINPKVFKIYDTNVLANGLSHYKYIDLCNSSNLNKFENPKPEGDSYLKGSSENISFTGESRINIYSIDTSILSSLGDYLNYKHIIPKIPIKINKSNLNDFNILLYHHPVEYWWLPSNSNAIDVCKSYSEDINVNLINRISSKGEKIINESFFNFVFCGHIHKNNFKPDDKGTFKDHFPITLDKNITVSGYLEYRYEKNNSKLSFNIVEINPLNDNEIDYSVLIYLYNEKNNKFRERNKLSLDTV